MTIIDPIADMFTRIRNALGVQHEHVSMPFSKIKCEIAKILLKEGYISGYEVLNEDIVKKKIKIELKYSDSGQPVISSIKKISKSGSRVTIKKSDIPKVLNGFGINILSTSHGVLTGKEARVENVGGELIAEVY